MMSMMESNKGPGRGAGVSAIGVIALATALMAAGTAFGQTDLGSLPGVSAPGAYGDVVNTGATAASSTQRALQPPRGVTSDAATGLRASVGIGATRNSNPRRVPEGQEESDTSYVLNPAISYGGELGRHLYELGYSAGYQWYDEFDSEDSEYQRLAAALQLDLTRILLADLYASRVDGQERRGLSGSREIGLDEELDEFQVDTVGGRITLGRRANLLQIYVGAETNQIEFTNNNQGLRDRDQDILEAGLFFNVGPATSLFVHARRSDNDYVFGNPGLDNTEDALTAGVTWEATEAISVTLEGGQLEKEYDDPGIEGFDGTTYLGKILWRPRERTSMSLYASRTTEESGAAGSAFYVSEVAGIDLTQRIGERLSVTLHYASADDEYDNGRVDDIRDYGIALGYGLFPWMDVGLSHAIVDRESTDPDNDYKDEVTSIFVVIRPRLGSE